MNHIQSSLLQAAQRQLTAHRSSIRRQHKAAVARRKSACARVGT
jgi:hypothetical protein